MARAQIGKELHFVTKNETGVLGRVTVALAQSPGPVPQMPIQVERPPAPAPGSIEMNVTGRPGKATASRLATDTATIVGLDVAGRTVTQLKMLTPDADWEPTDQVRIAGVEFEIVGDVEDYNNGPFVDTRGRFAVNLRRVSGGRT